MAVQAGDVTDQKKKGKQSGGGKQRCSCSAETVFVSCYFMLHELGLELSNYSEVKIGKSPDARSLVNPGTSKHRRTIHSTQPVPHSTYGVAS